MRCTLLIDPSTLSSAQLKIMSFRLKRIITNPKVRAAMMKVETAFKPYAHLARKVQEEAPFGAVALGVKYYFPFPKSGTKKEKAARFGGQPCVSAIYGDLDNRNKAVQDALVKAGAFSDDRYITTLLLRKRYTLSTPRIEIAVTADLGGYDNEPFSLAEKPENAVAEMRRAEIEKRLVVGAEVVVGHERKWDYEKGDSFIKGVRVLTVEKVTNKLVFFKDEYRQYKKDYVLRSLARGIDNGGFSYLADIDLTNLEISRPVSR